MWSCMRLKQEVYESDKMTKVWEIITLARHRVIKVADCHDNNGIMLYEEVCVICIYFAEYFSDLFFFAVCYLLDSLSYCLSYSPAKCMFKLSTLFPEWRVEILSVREMGGELGVFPSETPISVLQLQHLLLELTRIPEEQNKIYDCQNIR